MQEQVFHPVQGFLLIFSWSQLRCYAIAHSIYSWVTLLFGQQLYEKTYLIPKSQGFVSFFLAVSICVWILSLVSGSYLSSASRILVPGRAIGAFIIALLSGLAVNWHVIYGNNVYNSDSNEISVIDIKYSPVVIFYLVESKQCKCTISLAVWLLYTVFTAVLHPKCVLQAVTLFRTEVLFLNWNFVLTLTDESSKT